MREVDGLIDRRGGGGMMIRTMHGMIRKFFDGALWDAGHAAVGRRATKSGLLR